MGGYNKSGTPNRNQTLSWVANAYAAEAAMKGLIGQLLMPPVSTSEQNALFNVMSKDIYGTITDAKRKSEGGYKRLKWDKEKSFYNTVEYGLEVPDDDTNALLFSQDTGMSSMDVGVKMATTDLVLGQEKRIADLLFNVSNFPLTTGLSDWSDRANSTPIDDVSSVKSAFRLKSGKLPDALAMSYNNFENLKHSASLTEKTKYQDFINVADMGKQALATLLGIPQIIVAESIYNAAGKKITSDMQDIWSDDYIFMLNINNSPNFTQPGVGNTINWTLDSLGLGAFEVYREDEIRSDIGRVRHWTSEFLLRTVNADVNTVTTKSKVYQDMATLFSATGA